MYMRNPIHCIVPPYMTEQLAHSPNPQVRARAIAHLSTAAHMRALREAAQATPSLMATMSPTQTKHRLVYDAQQTDRLPGRLARAEGQPCTADPAVDEAYDFSGDTYDFFQQLFQRNSLDDNGMSMISSVHVAEVGDGEHYVPMNNAFWNGRQMAYGDGDGLVFQRFTQSLDVVAHELSHGVQSFTSNLRYYGQSGALNEHFADVFGVLVRQWKNDETAAQANWVVGAEVLVPAPTRRGIRDMENPGTAYRNDPDLGNDPQPADMSQLYTGWRNRGGVHINSGIPNRAFVLTAKALGGNAWDIAGRIWYQTLLQLTTTSQFSDCARLTLQVAAAYGAAAQSAVRNAWQQVGISL